MKYFLELATYTNSKTNETFNYIKVHSGIPDNVNYIEFEGDIEKVINDKNLIKNNQIDIELLATYAHETNT